MDDGACAWQYRSSACVAFTFCFLIPNLITMVKCLWPLMPPIQGFQGRYYPLLASKVDKQSTLRAQIVSAVRTTFCNLLQIFVERSFASGESSPPPDHGLFLPTKCLQMKRKPPPSSIHKIQARSRRSGP